jgi:hypothetical protein
MYLHKVISKEQLRENFFLLATCLPLTKKAESGFGSVSQWYGSADPDPYQNVTDPQRCSYPNISLFSNVLCWHKHRARNDNLEYFL